MPRRTALLLQEGPTRRSQKSQGRRRCLTRHEFIPEGYTTLLDAIGTAINETARQIEALPEDQRPGKVIFVIVTDGLENASREYSRDAVLKLIQERRERHGREFAFLGANQDAIAEGGNLGIGANTSLTYSASGAGAGAAFCSVSSLVGTIRTSAGAGPGPSFSDADRKAQERLDRQRRKQRPSKN